MHIISHKKLLEAGREHRDAESNLNAWYRVAKGAKWKNLDEIRQTYSSADGVPVGDRVYTVFNISGNKYRLITEIFYEDRTILVRRVLTHADYDKEEWKQ